MSEKGRGIESLGALQEMNLFTAMSIYGGGVGSGCRGPNCGRKPSGYANQLASKLESLGGKLSTYDKRTIRTDPDLKDIVTRGQVFEGGKKAIFRQKEANSCHGNVCGLWIKSGGKVQMATGYALTDGRWAQHSWGVKGGQVLETTGPREKYFGVVFNHDEAKAFYRANRDNLQSKGFLIHPGQSVKAEVGTPGARNTGTGNLIEPQPKNDVPSLKKRQKVLLDEERDALEERYMPDAAKARKQYLQRRAGKSGGLQTW